METVILQISGVDTNVDVYTVEEYKNIYDTLETKKKMVTHSQKKTQYLNSPVCFDIETSHIDIDNDEKKRFSFMYIWQMSIDGIVVIGRYWKEWIELLHFLHEKLCLCENRKMIIYVHNLGYEYAFFHKRVPIKSVFCREPNSPMKCELDDDLWGIEFRCSYILSGYSLAKWAENTPSCPIGKLVGDLDYDVLRTPKTKISSKELAYCVSDVLVMHYCIEALIKEEKTKKICYIPLTKTGFVRRLSKNSFGKDQEYRRFYYRQQLTAFQFMMYNRAFRGGDTHANAIWCGQTINDVFSFDITSSYPFRLVAEEYPLSKPITLKDPTVDQLKWLIRNRKLFIIDITITDVKRKGIQYFNYIPLSKCVKCYGTTIDNGRIDTAKLIKITTTSKDFEIIYNNYDFKINKINYIVYHTTKGLLPKALREFVLDIYKSKTVLKGVSGKEVEYMHVKEWLNSIYGMCVTNPLQDEILFDEETSEWIRNALPIDENHLKQIGEELEKNYKSRNSFLAYEVGVWTAAYARYELNKALMKIGTDAVYWDTDSIKFVNRKNYKVFDEINNDILHRLTMAGYKEDEYAPKTKKGIRKPIGYFDEEYPDGVTFKTFGSKKYFYEENNEPHITVAGLNKKKATKYLTDILRKRVVEVEIGQVFDSEHSGRTYSIYSEEHNEAIINGEYIEENSYVSIVPTSYTLGDTAEHKMYTILTQGILQRERGNGT